MMEKPDLIKKSSTKTVEETRNEWFDQLIHLIQTDKQFLSLGIASKETQSMWDTIIFDKEKAVSNMREFSTQYYISHLVVDYFKEITKQNIKPISLYLDHNDSQLLVWAEINEDDEVTEKGLYKAEAITNAKYYNQGFYISSTILEDCDNLSVPPHYTKVDLLAN